MNRSWTWLLLIATGACADLLSADFDVSDRKDASADGTAHDAPAETGGSSGQDVLVDTGETGVTVEADAPAVDAGSDVSIDAPVDAPSDVIGEEAPDCGACLPINGTASCEQGACVLACAAGFRNCDSLGFNGCEENVTSSSSHCGSCSHDCLGGACVASKCQPTVLIDEQVYSGFVAPWGIAIDQTHVFVAVTKYPSLTGFVLRMEKDGSDPVKLSNEAEPYEIALDADTVYWTNNLDSTGTVRKIAKTGGTAVTLASAQTKPLGISVDSGYVYWANAPTSGLGAVRRIPKAGGTAVDIAPSQGRPRSTYADPLSNFVYFVTTTEQRVESVPKTGGATTTIVNGIDSVWRLEPDPNGIDLYFTTYVASGGVYRVDRNAVDAIPTPVAPNQDNAYYLYVDLTHVYFTSHHQTNGFVARWPKLGGAVEYLATQRTTPTVVTGDAQAIYWAEYDGNRVMKLAK